MTNNCDLNEAPRAETPAHVVSPGEQQELRERYEEQQRRLYCPGCGEEPFVD